jgi:hypothetical protein
MTLTVGRTYRVYLNCGEGREWSVIRLKVVSDEGGSWYKVESAGQTFLINLNQAVRIYED